VSAIETKPTDPLAFDFGLDFKPASARIAGEARMSPSSTTSLSAFGISIPIADFPGTGDWIRTSAVLAA